MVIFATKKNIAKKREGINEGRMNAADNNYYKYSIRRYILYIETRTNLNKLARIL